MVQQLQVFLFGDQTFDFAADLKTLLQSNSNPILSAFFEQTYYALRAEVNRVPVTQRIQFPRFSSLGDLLSEFREGNTNPAFQTALACAFQLGNFIRQYGEVGRAYPLPGDTFLVGLCTGALAAAAISSSNSLSQLLPAAVHTVAISFRLGLCVTDLRNRIEPNSDSPWSVVFPGVSVQKMTELLEEYCTENCLSPTSRPWISAHVPNGVTVSGPPSTLERFRLSPEFKTVRTRSIPIRVPAHTSHLFTLDDVNSILDTTAGATWASYTSKIPVISSATGKLVWAGNYKALQQTALRDILMEPLRWDKVNGELSLLLRSSGADKVKLIPIGSAAANMVSTALKEASSAESEMEIIIEHQESKADSSPENLPLGKSKLAIVGVSGRFPDAETPSAFWDLLHQGLDVAKEVPPRRWDTNTHVDPACKVKNTGATPWGCWLDHPELFDARFFSISPKEAPQIDPAQRLALMSTYEAMEQSGLVCGSTPSTQPDRIGVFHGITSNDYMETNSSQDIDTYFIPGGNRAFVAGRLNFCFQFCGPSYTNDTACSSSLAAIHLACNSLWRHDVDTAVAGGTNMINNPDGHTGLDRGFFLSRTGNCKTYDDKADGYCRAEGVGTIIIKRLEDAIAENDPILGVILDVKTNHSAESDSMTRPHVGAQKANMEHVFNTSGVDPKTVGYVEMHGTGTQVGDAVEMESVLSVFDPRTTSKPRSKEQTLYLGSAKANIGHGEGVSGVTSLIKVLLMFQNNEIPPHCGIKPGSKINHTFPTDLTKRNIRIAFEPTHWGRPAATGVRRALINNFSAAGGNTAMLLEDAPDRRSPDVAQCDARTCHLVTVSAKSPASLKGNIQNLLEYLNLESNMEVPLHHLSYTMTSRRMHYQHRIVVSGADITGIKTQLQAALERGDGMTRSKAKPSIVFAFTGQGAQYLGMGKQFFDAISSFRRDIIRFDQLACSQKLPSFKHIFTTSEGDIGEFSPAVVQLATTCMQMALARLWRSYGVLPELVVGHSLGEYAALNVSGVLSDADAIFLVGTRAELLQKCCKRGTHAMLAVKASIKTISSLLTDFEIACINGPEDTVLGGSIDLISKQQNILGKNHLKSTILQTPYAFHTSQVDPVLDTFVAEAKGVIFNKPSVPVICPLLGNIVTEIGTFSPEYLGRHCREAVDMRTGLEAAKTHGLIKANTFVIEIGPHPVVSGMFKATLGQQLVALPSMHRSKDSWLVLSAAMAALYAASHDLNWVEYHAAFPSSQKVLQLPAYSWDLKEYWIKYENDWCVTKGNPSAMAAMGLLQGVQSNEKSIALPTPKLETTTIHRLVEETIEDQKAVIVVESDFSRPDLNAIAKGHKVNQIPLTTPSVYADMALVLGTYFLDRFRPGMKERLVDVTDLVVEKALIPHSEGPQLLRTQCKIDWRSKSADLVFYSINDMGKATIGHATCTIRFTDQSQLKLLQAKIHDFKSRMAYLKEGIESGRSMRLNQTQGYKLISTLAQFHPDYRAIDNVTLDSHTLEASTSVSFGQVKSTGTFSTHPAYIDVMTQTAGFVMNGKDDTDLDVEIFVNHGWKSLQIYAEILPGKSYQTYVKMIQGLDGLWHGDTVMFDGDEIVAFFKDVSLRGVPRSMFRVILAAADAQNPRKSKKDRADNAPAKPAQTSNAPVPTARLTTPVQTTATPKAATTIPPPKITETPIKAAAPPQKDHITPALAIVSEESGIAVSDLTDDSVFLDIGVDSLLSMVIASRFREELGIDLDIDFSLFVDLPTVKHLKDFLQPSGSTGPEESQSTAQAEIPDSQPQEVTSQEAAKPEAPAQMTGTLPSSKNLELIASAMNVISEESGIALEDLTDDCVFLDIGVDSLLSMVIASRFREEIGIDLDIDFSLFVDLPSVKDLKDFLGGGTSSAPTEALDQDMSSGDSCGSGSITPDNVQSLSDSSELSAPDVNSVVARPSSYCRPATSVILQNFPKIAARTLIMLPDGGGSSSSYVPIPRLNIDVAIVGLNCPYARDAWNMKCNYNDLLDSYMTEIRRRQPKGPYNLGGWSSGGVMAYMAAYRLLNEGEQVDNLIIIDSPVPETMDRLPEGFYEFCETLGLYGTSTGTTVPAPEWLIPHFIATVDVLDDYRAYPLQGISKWPKVSIVWACESVLDEKNKPPPELMASKGSHFLLEKRKDFGPCGWDTLMPGSEFMLERVVGGNHFSMMQRPLVAQIGKFIEKAMG